MLDKLFVEYQRIVNEFIGLYWNEKKLVSKATATQWRKVTTWLCGKAVKCAYRQTIQIIKATQAKNKQRIYKAYQRVFTYAKKKNKPWAIVTQKWSEWSVGKKFRDRVKFPVFNGNSIDLNSEVKKNSGKKCIISGVTERLVAHHIYGFTQYPILADKLINGICLSDDIHKEFHSIYGRENRGYFDFKDFFFKKTGREFFLLEEKNLIVDVVLDADKLLEKKKIFWDLGINYIPIWEFELFNKVDILESMFSYKRKGIESKVFARECSVVEVGAQDAKEFLQKNHRQGSVYSQVNYGLQHPEIGLVSVMSFGIPRFSTGFEYELLRFCSLLNTSVVGGASKLFQHFVKKQQPKNIVSYCDVRFSHLDPSLTIYPRLGFKYLHTSKPNYFYYKDGEVFSRIKFQKHKLPELLPSFDPSLSEKQNMLNNGYEILEDCGNHVFVFSI